MEIEKYKKQEDIKKHIIKNNYHDALTQVCFGCNKVRTNLKLK